jgi:glycosyltransferase involved in cell wall biosynthesis
LNEEMHLQSSLEAIFNCRPLGYEIEVLYVDSGSTDRSVEIAAAVRGVEVIHLNHPRPSAARARNAGLRRAKGEFVQLIDGDSVLQPGWLESALGLLERQRDVSCVFGRCIEMHPDQSIYMKVCGFDWYIPPGDRRFCGGNAMWRMSVITAHDYFNEELQVGEEPELCYRVRHTGGRIQCLDIPMVTHDLAMRRFSDYWNRGVSSGKGYAAIALRYWRNSEKMWLRETLVNFAEPTLWLMLLLFGWQLFGWVRTIAIIVTWWLLRSVQIAFTVRRRNIGWRSALMYGLHCQFVRVPVALGQLKTLLGR